MGLGQVSELTRGGKKPGFCHSYGHQCEDTQETRFLDLNCYIKSG